MTPAAPEPSRPTSFISQTHRLRGSIAVWCKSDWNVMLPLTSIVQGSDRNSAFPLTSNFTAVIVENSNSSQRATRICCTTALYSSLQSLYNLSAPTALSIFVLIAEGYSSGPIRSRPRPRPLTVQLTGGSSPLLPSPRPPTTLYFSGT